MATFISVEGDSLWVNVDAIESIQVQNHVVLINTSLNSHIYSTLCLDEDHAKLIAARLVGMIMGIEEQRPEGTWPEDGYTQSHDLR